MCLVYRYISVSLLSNYRSVLAAPHYSKLCFCFSSEPHFGPPSCPTRSQSLSQSRSHSLAPVQSAWVSVYSCTWNVCAGPLGGEINGFVLCLLGALRGAGKSGDIFLAAATLAAHSASKGSGSVALNAV